MKLKTILAAAFMTAVAAPAFAQSFYVVQDVKTRKCTITETGAGDGGRDGGQRRYGLQDQG